MRKLVAPKVSDPDGLGAMLDIEAVQISMIKGAENNIVTVNMKILNVWKEEETKTPVTWRTLIDALRDLKMIKLARQITEELEQRP